MCGQFHLDKKDIVKISKKYSLVENIPYNDIKPTQPSLVLLKDYKSDIFQFGLSRKNLIINAKSETLLEKPTFQKIYTNHCIIPASYYYEWDAFKNKITFYSEELLYFAALYSNHQFVILTTEANASVEKIHNRMPLILNDKEMLEWLNNINTDVILKKKNLSLKNNQKFEQLTLF